MVFKLNRDLDFGTCPTARVQPNFGKSFTIHYLRYLFEFTVSNGFTITPQIKKIWMQLLQQDANFVGYKLDIWRVIILYLPLMVFRKLLILCKTLLRYFFIVFKNPFLKL